MIDRLMLKLEKFVFLQSYIFLGPWKFSEVAKHLEYSCNSFFLVLSSCKCFGRPTQPERRCYKRTEQFTIGHNLVYIAL